MADPLYELLTPYFDAQTTQSKLVPSAKDSLTITYINRLTTLPLSSLTTSEPQSLAQNSQSVLRSLQALSKRSYQPIITSSDHLLNLRDTIPKVTLNAAKLKHALPKLEQESILFSEKYSKSMDNPVLDRRKKAMLLSRNVDRISDVLDLPTLLSSAISISTTTSQGTGSGATSSASANYASALDLYGHIKRLHTLYPDSGLVNSISAQAEQEMKSMTTNLIASLQAQGIKLAGAMRTVGWLRRVAPDLDETWNSRRNTTFSGSEGSLGSLFLVCRLANLLTTLEALEPLRELADHETARRKSSTTKNGKTKNDKWSGGQQTERYLKRYIEIFREQSFAIISMYKSIFPSALPAPDTVKDPDDSNKAPTLGQQQMLSADQRDVDTAGDALQPLPSALATFPMHLIDLLMDTLTQYLPNVQDRSSRDSLLTQVLYCAGSLGRLGGDFGLLLSSLGDSDDEHKSSEDEDEDEDEEWVEVIKKHRVQASRLELLASGVGSGRPVISPVIRE
ncbi:Dor1-domain-containing protein [Patellaria atrata CBS 101060]|uniref:Conserved oligomeric Golgi complex subunit 8 n=1 Tax=Patellaria atrata CBS 101060 TaxID=1346257 RepID=A0A9P4VSH2_9PEZI|nr:Dor1-domain-containing protein [Patellaria atrata CBS 101060]